MANVKAPSQNLIHFPYSDLKDGILENWKGTSIAAVSLQPIDIECADQEAISQIGETLRRFLNELSAEFTYRITARNEIHSGSSHRTFTLWIEYLPKAKGLVLSLFNSRDALSRLADRTVEDREKISVEQDRILRTLKQLGIFSKCLADKEILEELKRFFRPETKLPIQNLEALRSADLIITDNVFFYDHSYWTGLSVAEYPDAVSTGQMVSCLLYDTQCFTTVIFKPCDSQRIVNQLKQRRKVSASLTNTFSRLRDVESEAKLQSEDELLESLVVGQEKVFECQVSSFVSGLDPQFAEFKLSKLSDQFRGLGYQVYREALGLYSVFSASVPGGQIESSRSQLLPSSCAQALLPVFNIDKGHDKPVLEFKDRFGSKVGIDPWDSSLASYNAVVSGTSGSGKSFLSNILLKNLFESGNTSVFIVDLGGSYRRLTQLKNGQNVSFDLKGKNAFNPLGNLKDGDPSILELSTDILRAILSTEDNPLSPLERSIIYKELAEISDRQIVTLSFLRDKWRASKIPFLRDSATVLYRWTGNTPYGALLDTEKILDTGGDWTCFDLLGLNDTPDLQRVVMLSIVKRIRELIRRSEGRKVLVLDEVWSLIGQYSEFIGELFRTVRKHNAMAMAISQSMEDFDTEELRKAVLNMTPTKIILKQSMPPAKLSQMLGLNSRETEIVHALKSIKGEYSEMFMLNGEKHRFLKLESTPDEYWLATTNPKDLEFINHFLKSHPELTELQACKEIAKRYGRSAP